MSTYEELLAEMGDISTPLSDASPAIQLATLITFNTCLYIGAAVLQKFWGIDMLNTMAAMTGVGPITEVPVARTPPSDPRPARPRPRPRPRPRSRPRPKASPTPHPVPPVPRSPLSNQGLCAMQYPVVNECARLHQQSDIWLFHQLKQLAYGCYPIGVCPLEGADPGSTMLLFNRQVTVTEKTRQKLVAEAMEALYAHEAINAWREAHPGNQSLLLVHGDLVVRWDLEVGRPDGDDDATDHASQRAAGWVRLQDAVLRGLLEWVAVDLPHEAAWRGLMGTLQLSQLGGANQRCFSQRYMCTAAALHLFGQQLPATMPLAQKSRRCWQQLTDLAMTKERDDVLGASPEPAAFGEGRQ